MKPRTWFGALEKSADDSRQLIIHFTHAGATVLHADLSGAKPRILRFAAIKSDPSLTEQERKNGFLGFLSALNAKKYPSVTLTWSDGMTYRQLEIPPMPAEDTAKAVEWELKKKYYFNPDDNFLGFREVMDVEAEEGRAKLLNAFYCEKKAVSSRLAFVQDLGLEIVSIVPGPAAFSNFAGDTPSPEHDTLVCERDGAFVRIVLVRENRSMLVRQVALGPQEAGQGDDALKRIAEEVRKTVDFYESQKYFRPVAKALLAGAWDDEERACAVLGQHLEIKVERADMEGCISEALSEEDKDFIRKNAGLFAAPIGAVLMRDDTMNLVPADIKLRNREKRIDRWINLALLGTAFLMFLVAAGFSTNTYFLKKQMKTLEKEHERISEKKRAFEDILGLERVRRAIFRGEVYSPSMLKELSQRTPAIVTLTELQYSRQDGTLILRGEVQDSARESVKSVTQYAASLSESPFYTTVTVTSTDRDAEKKVLRFEINCVLKGLL